MLVRTLALTAALAAAPSLASADPGFHGHGRGPVTFVRRGPVRVEHVHRHTDSHCRYEPGYHDVRVRRVVVPGHYVEREVPAEFEVRWSTSRCAYVRVLVCAARVERTWVPERVELRRHRVWVPGRWVCC